MQTEARRSVFQPQDFAWLLFVAALIATTPETNYNATILLVVIGAFQIVEPRLRPFSSKSGQIASLVLKLLFSYLLVGYTHTIFSPYYPIFLIPVVSAATIFELPAVILVTLIACLLYSSFLLPIFIDWNTFQMPPGYGGYFGCAALFLRHHCLSCLPAGQSKARRNGPDCGIEQAPQGDGSIVAPQRTSCRARSTYGRSRPRTA